MSASNFFLTLKKAFLQRTKTITNLAAYTAKVGSVANNFVCDRVISIVTTADGNDLVLTVPAGVYAGQRLMLIFTTKGDNETVTVTITGSTVTLNAAAEWVELIWVSASIGWRKIRYASGV